MPVPHERTDGLKEMPGLLNKLFEFEIETWPFAAAFSLISLIGFHASKDAT